MLGELCDVSDFIIFKRKQSLHDSFASQISSWAGFVWITNYNTTSRRLGVVYI